MDKCFVCQEEEISQIRCAKCLKRELCNVCWKKWLFEEFRCPFCKYDVMLVPETQYFKIFDLFRRIEDEEFMTNQLVYKDGDYQPLDLIRKNYKGFWNNEYASSHLEYFEYIEESGASDEYGKFIRYMILDNLLNNDLYVNIKDLEYFGGWEYIDKMNKRFDNKIIVTNEKTMIRFNMYLWSPRYGASIFETDTMKYMYNRTKTMYGNLYYLLKANLLLDRIDSESEWDTRFKEYYFKKFNNVNK
jgi:hypothetical protein